MRKKAEEINFSKDCFVIENGAKNKTNSKNKTTYFKLSYMKNQTLYKDFGPTHLRKVTVNLEGSPLEGIDLRLKMIKELPADDTIAKLCDFHVNANSIEQTYQFLPRSSNLSEVMLKHRSSELQLLPSQIFILFFQVAEALKKAGEKQVNHLRLLPNSILIAKPQSSYLAVQVCDFGVGIEKWSSQAQRYLHPQLNGDAYKSNQNGLQYDLWSFGVLFYEFMSGKTAVRVNLASSWLQKNPIQNLRLGNIIQKCCCIHNEQFKNWGEIQKILDQQVNMLQIYQMPVKPILESHIRFIFLVTQIYLTIQRRIQPKELFHDDSFKIAQLGECLLAFSYLLHSRDFMFYYGAKIHTCGQTYLLMLDKISQLFKVQLQFMQKTPILIEIEQKPNVSIVSICEKIKLRLAFLMMEKQKMEKLKAEKLKAAKQKMKKQTKQKTEKQKTEKWKMEKLKCREKIDHHEFDLVIKFVQQMMVITNEINKCMQNPATSDVYRFVHLFYDNQKMAEIADKQLHFEIDEFIKNMEQQ